MVNKNLMDELDRLGFGADVDALESHVALLQEAAGDGNPIATDSQYDMYVRLLKELRPQSEVLLRNWETEDNELEYYDEILESRGMKSILTIQDIDELYKFEAELGDKVVDLFSSVKLNGHAIRAVYHYGNLVSGSTRGRYKKGRNITRHLKAVLPNHVEAWSGIRLVEVRGEMLVKLETFDKYLRETLKTPLSAVTSLIRESATDKELEYLSCVCYKVIPSEDSGIMFGSLEEEFDELEACGFEVPIYLKSQDIGNDNLEETFFNILEYFESKVDKGLVEYATDGVVVAVNDTETFLSMGTDGNHYNANFAIKMGKYWECNIYKGIITDIIFMPGKKYFTPKARIEPVVTATGASVTTVPLYNVGVMDDLKLIPGQEVYFRFGGETGVTLCRPDGTMISER